MIGQTVSHYRILEELGSGGMGVVYKAEDTKLKRTVALKFLPPELTRDKAAKTRFIHEAQAASALQHHNICTIHEIDETKDGRLFIVMDCYDGETLKENIAKGPLPVAEAVNIAIQVADGLAEAHRAGMVHRDLKPANIMVTRGGVAKILDFGLAKLAGQTKVTRTGTTVGTVAYMSPEQARGEEVDLRSDIWSLGVVLYEMLAGEAPFMGDHEVAVLYKIMNEVSPPVTGVRTGVPIEVERIIGKCMAKKPDERYQHVDNLLADLRGERKSPAYATTAVKTRPARLPRSVQKKVVPLLAGVLVILFVVIGYFALLKRKDPTTGAGRPSIAVLYLQNLSANKEDEYFAAGMTEDIITQLSKVGGLLVASRSDVEQFKNKQIELKTVADELRVNYVMEGSVRKYGDKIRITCQLIKADDGFHVWADSYDKQMEDLFAIQADVAKSVARALKVALVPFELKRIEKMPTMNMRAYNYYLQGREYYIGLESAELRESLQLAANMFEKAIEADSNFALAYAGLSDCYCYPVMHGIDPKRSWLDQAEGTVLKALALDPNLGEARRALSRLYFTKGETEKAIHEAEETVRANPDYGTGWRTLGDSWLYSGQYSKAEGALMKALEVNPTDRSLFCSIIDLYSLWGDRNKAEGYFRRGLEVQPRNANIYNFGSRWCIRSGELEEAKRRAYKGLNTNPHSSFNMENLMWIFMMSGKEDSSSFYLNEVHRENPEADYFVEMSWLALMRGNKKQAEVYADSCIQSNQPLIREFEGMPYEYASRLSMALAYAFKGESRKALEQAESVRRSLGESLLSVEWAAGRGIVSRLSFVYSLTGQKEEAMRMLDFLVKINCCSPAYIRLHPWFKNLSGYPPFEALIGRKTE